MGKLTTTLLTGYRDYAKEHPEADYSGLGENFIGYLNTERAQEILKNNIKDIIEASGSVEVSKEELQQLIKDIMTGFQKYAQEKGYTDMTKLDEYLTGYLQTEEMPADPDRLGRRKIFILTEMSISRKNSWKNFRRSCWKDMKPMYRKTVTRIRRKWVSTLWIIWEQTAQSRNFLQGL